MADLSTSNVDAGDESAVSRAEISKFVSTQVQQSQVNLLSEIDRLIARRMQDQTHEFRRLSSRQPDGEQYTFRKKGHEEQHKVNTKVLASLSEAQGYMQTAMIDGENSSELRASALANAHEEMRQGEEVLSHRNKLVKLADMSDSGWRTVSEYETHQLADNSDDEKRIQKAESRASRKLKENQKKRSLSRSRSSFASAAVPRVQTSDYQSHAPPQRRSGSCFACGKPGHWRFECNVVKSTQATGQSTSVNTSVARQEEPAILLKFYAWCSFKFLTPK